MKTRVVLTLLSAAAMLLPACGADQPTNPTGGGGAAKSGTNGGSTPPKADPTKPEPAKKEPAKKEPAKDPNAKFTAKEKRLADVQFKTYCVTCHGTKGKGDGPAGAALNPKPRNWTDEKWQEETTDESLFKVIQKGGASVGLSPLMAPNPMYGTDEHAGVIHALVEKVRSFKGKK